LRLLLVATLVLAISLPAIAQDVNGSLEIVDGKPVLRVWGTHAERGYAAGYLMGESGKEVFDDYFVGYVCGGSPFLYNYYRSTYLNNFAVDARYQQEADYTVLGMADAGVDLYNGTIGRDMDATDILVSNAIVDLSQRDDVYFGCSSMSSWGQSTINDPTLGGHLVITRHLDWSKHPTLTDNPALVVHFPAESDEQPWLSVGYAGFFGALSSVSESGVAAFMDMGNSNAGTTGAPYQPILFTIRSGMEMADYDGDGSHSPDDVTAAIQDRTRRGGNIIHATMDDGVGSRPIVIECNNAAGVATRDQSDNTVVPGDNLVATNHFRALYSPTPCSRYDALVDSLTANPEISPARSWSVMAGAAGQSSNIQAIQYIESEGLLYWAMDTYSQPAYMQEPTEFDIDELFMNPTEVSDVMTRSELAQPMPNPFNPTTTLTYTLVHSDDVELAVYDVSGRLVKMLESGPHGPGEHSTVWMGRDESGRELSSGVYFVRLLTGDTVVVRKMVMVK
jgi:hypothetical protein